MKSVPCERSEPVLATIARLAADASHTYFEHLGWAAALWLVFFAPVFLQRPRPGAD